MPKATRSPWLICTRRTSDSPITNTPPEELKKGHRIEDVGDATPLYDQIWTEIKQ